MILSGNSAYLYDRKQYWFKVVWPLNQKIYGPPNCWKIPMFDPKIPVPREPIHSLHGHPWIFGHPPSWLPLLKLICCYNFFSPRWWRQISKGLVSPTWIESFMRSSGDILSALRTRLPEQDGQDRLLRVGQHREARRLRTHQLSAFRQWQWLRDLRYRSLICFFRSID